MSSPIVEITYPTSEPSVEIVYAAEAVVEVTYSPEPVIDVTAPGPQGPRGEQGLQGVGVVFLEAGEEVPPDTPAPSLIVQPLT